MVADSVAYLADAGRTVFFDAEHFFDGYLANPAYAVEVCTAAAKAGAAAVVLCDTNGGTLPQDVSRIVADMRELLPGVTLGVHTHNDNGCAVANSLLAVAAGCAHVQGTMNGYGERAGNADLTSIIPALVLKMGDDALDREQLQAADRGQPLRRRDRERLPVPAPAVRGYERVRAQGRRSRERRGPTARGLRARRSRRGGQSRPLRGERTGRQGLAHAQGARDGHRPGRRPRDGLEGPRRHQGARVPRLHVRGRGRVARDHASQGDGQARPVLPPRVVPRHRREARGRPGHDRGHHQGALRRASATSPPPRATAP